MNETTDDYREIVVSETEDRCRLDKFVQTHAPNASRGAITRLLAQGHMILVDGATAAKGVRLRAGQRVHIHPALFGPPLAPKRNASLHVITATPTEVVIDKPAGKSCYPIDPTETDTVAHALAAKFPECVKAGATPQECGLVHRLDYGTSGVLIAARSDAAYQAWRSRFAEGQVSKRYLALVAGHVASPITIDFCVCTDPANRRRMRALPQEHWGRGQEATTTFMPLTPIDLQSIGFQDQPIRYLTVVEATCATGRRHQVRIHAAAAGYPLVGDPLYGGPVLFDCDLPFLHAQSVTNNDITFTAPLPEPRAALLKQLGHAAQKS